MAEPTDNPPIPDPTILTTEQLIRAVQAERDYVDGKVELLLERLRGIDNATILLNETVNRVPTETQTAVGRLQDLTDEKFRSVSLQFKERDTRSERESRDNKVAVDAAFAAQKEAASEKDKANTLAITKSEVGTLETINKLERLFTTKNDGLSDKIDDLKDRIGRLESVKVGSQQAYAGLYVAVGLVIAVISIAVSILIATHK